MSTHNLIVGLDFDNTIVCYDDIFHRVALEKKLIPHDIPEKKESVRDYLRKAGQEDLWTEMQGYVYGVRMSEARAFTGALECISALRSNNITVNIISHKTRYPYKGEAYDLHKSAKAWLMENGVTDLEKIGLSPDNIFFLKTKQEKLNQIKACGCTFFVDDLPEFLSEPSFPEKTKKILFSSGRPEEKVYPEDILPLNSWKAIEAFLLAQ